jgi:hypothetical protein
MLPHTCSYVLCSRTLAPACLLLHTLLPHACSYTLCSHMLAPTHYAPACLLLHAMLLHACSYMLCSRTLAPTCYAPACLLLHAMLPHACSYTLCSHMLAPTKLMPTPCRRRGVPKARKNLVNNIKQDGFFKVRLECPKMERLETAQIGRNYFVSSQNRTAVFYMHQKGR